MGWHLYLKDSQDHQKQNKDGYSGWFRRPIASCAIEFLESLGFPITGDGTTDTDGIARFARVFPVSGEAGGRPRGGVKVLFDGQHLKPR